MNPSYDFTGQVALVTGASSGMGLATARAFAEAGASVVLADINQAALTSVTDELADTGHQVLGVPCDVPVASLVFSPLCDATGVFDVTRSCAARVHEARAQADAHPGQRRDRELFLPRRTRR